MKNIECKESGLVCDNPECDWKDTTVTLANMKDWLNRPCPRCGQNVLTEEDFNNAMALETMVNYINSLTEEQLEGLAANIELEELKNHPMLENGVVLEVNTHKDITFKIKTNEDNSSSNVGSVDPSDSRVSY